MTARTIAGERRLRLDGPLGDDGLLLQVDNLCYPLRRVSAKDMAEVLAADREKNRDIRGYPVWFSEHDAGVDLYPTPIDAFFIIRVFQ